MKKKIRLLGLCILSLILLVGCGSQDKLDPQNPVTLTMWHVYGSQTKSPLNDLIYEFNRTEGKEKGIIINVTSVTDSTAIQEALFEAAHDKPGSPELPDLFTTYPKTIAMIGADRVMDFKPYFTTQELSGYIQPFIEEGMLDQKLLVFPIAKSTELLFINQTAFDRFAAATGVTMESQLTNEGVLDAALRYAAWTDGQTPDVPGDARNFFMYNDLFNYFQTGIVSLGGNFFAEKQINFNDPRWQAVWDPFAKGAIAGGISLIDGFASDPMKTEEVISSTGSSAGVLYYRDTVTHADNTTEKIEFNILPYPVFENGQKMVIQRGCGLCAAKSTPEKEYAASIFARWLTSPDINTAFVTSAGYLPVTNDAFAKLFDQDLETIENPTYRKLYQAAKVLHEEYTFYTPPYFDEYAALETKFSQRAKEVLRNARQEYLSRVALGEDQNLLLDELAAKSFNTLQSMLNES